MKKMTWLIAWTPPSFALVSQRRALQRLGQQHLLGEDQVVTVVVRELVVVAHRDRIERAGDLAVAAEDAARQVDLIHRRVALARRDAVLRRVLRRDHADAVGRARRRAKRAADALLKARVLEAMELVAPAKARIHGHLLLGILDRRRPFGDSRERRLQPARRLCKSAPSAARRPGLGVAGDLDDVLAWTPRGHVQRRHERRLLY